MYLIRRIGLVFACLLSVGALVFAVAACGAAEEDEAEETAASTEETTTEVAEEEAMTEEVMEEEVVEEEEMAEEMMEEDEVEAGAYVAEPVVGEIFITSASEITEDNIFKARGLSVWTDDTPNRNSILRLRGNDYVSWDSDKRSFPVPPMRLMADTLVGFRGDNPMEPWDLRALPSLAESWEFPDDRTIVFNLREGVHFADKPPVNGRELVADDVAYSFERRLRPGGLNAGALGPLTSITALDNRTVEFKFSEPFAPFMTVIGKATYLIQPPEPEEEFGGLDDWEAAILTGPWTVEEYEVGILTSHVRNDNYWRGPNGVTGEDLPYVEKIFGVLIPDEAAAVAAYRGGLLDAGPAWQIWGAWGALKDQMVTFLDKPELLYNYHPAGGGAWTTYYYGARMAPGSPWENKKIRWGVALYNDISFEAWAPCCGGAQPTRWAAMDNPWFVPTEELSPDGQQFYVNFPGNTMDLDKARQYIREGKIELGLDPDEPIKTTMTVQQPDSAILDIATRMVADIAKIGIEAEIVANDRAQFQSVRSGNFTGMVVMYDSSGTAEADSLFYNRYYSGSDLNLPGVSDPVLDELILEGRRTLDPFERQKIYRDIQIIMAEQQYDWAVPNWTNENVFPEWVKNPGPFIAGHWEQYMYLTAWADHDHSTRTSWDWED